MTFLFDKSFWPKGGTEIFNLRVDLNDIWETHEEAATVFVAEALIADDSNHLMTLELREKIPMVEDYIWDCGGDVIIKKYPFDEMIDTACSDYDCIGGICSNEQKEDVEQVLNGLEVMAEKIESAKKKLLEQIEAFKKAKKK